MITIRMQLKVRRKREQTWYFAVDPVGKLSCKGIYIIIINTHFLAMHDTAKLDTIDSNNGNEVLQNLARNQNVSNLSDRKWMSEILLI